MWLRMQWNQSLETGHSGIVMKITKNHRFSIVRKWRRIFNYNAFWFIVSPSCFFRNKQSRFTIWRKKNTHTLMHTHERTDETNDAGCLLRGVCFLSAFGDPVLSRRMPYLSRISRCNLWYPHVSCFGHNCFELLSRLIYRIPGVSINVNCMKHCVDALVCEHAFTLFQSSLSFVTREIFFMFNIENRIV